MDDYLTILRNEFVSGPGSFAIQLRVQLIWDKQAFSRMTTAMLECCQAYNRQHPLDDPMGVDETPLPRWIAEGFWYYSWWVQSWTSHPAWSAKTKPEQDYYDAAYERLSNLAYWLFTGESMYINGAEGYAPM